MRMFVSAVMGAALLAITPAQAAPDAPEAKLARALQDRVAGKPVKCIDQHTIRSSQIIDRTAILYRVGSTVYVNRPEAGRESLDSWDTLVTDTHSHQLCSIDVVHLYDSGSRMRSGTVFLGEFVPYRKVAANRAD